MRRSKDENQCLSGHQEEMGGKGKQWYHMPRFLKKRTEDRTKKLDMAATGMSSLPE